MTYVLWVVFLTGTNQPVIEKIDLAALEDCSKAAIRVNEAFKPKNAFNSSGLIVYADCFPKAPTPSK